MGKQADVLRQMRLDKRLTQADVADKAKISQSHYSAIERGEKPHEIAAAQILVNRMRIRMYRTMGGVRKAGRRR